MGVSVGVGVGAGVTVGVLSAVASLVGIVVGVFDSFGCSETTASSVCVADGISSVLSGVGVSEKTVILKENASL